MSNSKLVNYTKLSPYCHKPRNAKIDKITIHHMAGNLSVETCGNVFQNSKSSSNYGIGTDGRVGMYVEEANRSWCSSSPANDHRAVTIEVANDGAAPNWHVSDKALAKLIELCVDICQRNGIEKLNYTGDKNGNLTRHNMFAATTCPGPYLESKFTYIADEVNKRLHKAQESPETEENIYRVRASWDNETSQIGAYKSLENAKKACPDGYTVYDNDGKAVYTKNATSYPVDPAQSFSKTRAGTYIVTATSLNLRCGASTSKKVIETMANGKTFTCYGYYTGDWLYGVSHSGNKGFCHKNYLKKK